ncbi:nucleotide-diphospho-sugar transferase [Desarmillaria ectypa]|nr:nucleotide-diphospho-sugar transferase [Desarmillaria ectypa]
MSPKAAWVSLLSKTAYLPGLLVVDYGLKAAKSKYPLIVMVTPDIPQDARNVLKNRGLISVDVGVVAPEASRQRFDIHDARFADTWSKVRTFEMVDYDRVVLLDADVIILRNMDELMDLDLPKDQIAAAHVCACNPRKLPHYPADWIPENCAHSAVSGPNAPPPQWSEGKPRPYSQLNSGVVVLNPSMAVANAIIERLMTSAEVENFTFADQDLMIEHFKGMWKPLPWYYNALRTLQVVHPKIWRDEEVRCLHYILPDKPWKARVPDEGTGSPFDETNRWWWAHFEKLGEELRAVDPEGWGLVSAKVAAK